MSDADQFMQKAREVVASMMKGDNPQKPMAPFIAAALHAQDQEARKSERERCAAVARACVLKEADDYWDKHDVSEQVAQAILSERTD